jgi:hypothetical protein
VWRDAFVRPCSRRSSYLRRIVPDGDISSRSRGRDLGPGSRLRTFTSPVCIRGWHWITWRRWRLAAAHQGQTGPALHSCVETGSSAWRCD